MAGRAPPALLPWPRRFEPRAGSFSLQGEPPIVLEPGADAGALAAAQVLQGEVAARCGARLPIETYARGSQTARCVALRCGEAGESHRLEVSPDRVRADGAGPAGLRYAVETLCQLVRPRGGIPCAMVEDEPDFELRGLMLDGVGVPDHEAPPGSLRAQPATVQPRPRAKQAAPTAAAAPGLRRGLGVSRPARPAPRLVCGTAAPPGVRGGGPSRET